MNASSCMELQRDTSFWDYVFIGLLVDFVVLKLRLMVREAGTIFYRDKRSLTLSEYLSYFSSTAFFFEGTIRVFTELVDCAGMSLSGSAPVSLESNFVYSPMKDIRVWFSACLSSDSDYPWGIV